MVDSICQIARTMGLKTVAEFVGDQETVDALSEIGVDFVQGFYIGEPEPLQDITARLQSERDAVSA